jgi:hypothetical protein
VRNYSGICGWGNLPLDVQNMVREPVELTPSTTLSTMKKQGTKTKTTMNPTKTRRRKKKRRTPRVH